MGNELATKALLEPILEDLARVKAEGKNTSEQVKHGWDKRDASDKMKVLDDEVTVGYFPFFNLINISYGNIS